MLIENIDALKDWLTRTLTPICDADPLTLAQYVVALVKKDKTEPDLRDLCSRELDVFLQDKTKDFVTELFVSLKSKSYLIPEASSSTSSLPKSVPNVTSTTSVSSSSLRSGKESDVKSCPTESDIRNGDRGVSASESVSSTRLERPDIRNDRRRNESGTDVRDRRPGRSPAHSRSRSKSPLRTRSPVRDLRDRLDRDDRRRRLPDRRRDSERDRAQPRRYGPRYDGPYRRPRRSPLRPRSRTRSRSKERFPRSRSRSKERFPRSRSPRPRSRSRSRSFSRSPRARSFSRSLSPRSRSGSPKGRRKPSSRSSTPPDYKLPEDQPVERKHVRPRCRDYDEKGFCMRGDLCAFDHGNDPVIVDDVNLPNVLSFPAGQPPSSQGPMIMAGALPGVRPHPPGMLSGPPPVLPRAPGPLIAGIRPDTPISMRLGPITEPPPGMLVGPKVEGNPPPPGTVPINMPPAYMPDPQPVFHPDPPYNPEAPSIPGPGYWPGSHGNHQNNLFGGRRDLLSVETTSDNSSNQRTVIASKRSFEESYRPFDNKHPGQWRNFDSSNAVLEVRKIPREFNNIAKINEHFGKFGTIVNLQVSYHGDPEAALVTFASHAQANAAYRSSEPVFNNRFIRVFWHKSETPTSEADSSHKPSDSTNIRNTIPPMHKLQLNNITKKMKLDTKESVIVSPTGFVTKTVFTSGALTKPPVHQRLGQSPQALRAAAEKKRAEEALRLKEEMNKKLEIQKQKRALLDKQVVQQKTLFRKLEENKALPAEKKAPLIQMIKALANSIDTLKQELKDPVTGSFPSMKPGTATLISAVPNSTDIPLVNISPPEHNQYKQQTQKVILDTELDIMTKESEGADTSELRQKVAALKRQAAAMGLLGRGRGRGRGAFAGRGRGHLPKTALSVDRRPKEVLVTGYMQEEKEPLMLHMKMFGEVEHIASDDDVPHLLVTYKTRTEAAKAVYEGPLFQGRKLSITFHKSAPSDNANKTADTSTTAGPDSTQEVEPVTASNRAEEAEADTSGHEADVLLDEGLDEDDSLVVGDELLEEVGEGDEVLLDDHELDDDELLGEDEDEEEARSWRR